METYKSVHICAAVHLKLSLKTEKSRITLEQGAAERCRLFARIRCAARFFLTISDNFALVRSERASQNDAVCCPGSPVRSVCFSRSAAVSSAAQTRDRLRIRRVYEEFSRQSEHRLRCRVLLPTLTFGQTSVTFCSKTDHTIFTWSPDLIDLIELSPPPRKNWTFLLPVWAIMGVEKFWDHPFISGTGSRIDFRFGASNAPFRALEKVCWGPG